MRMPFTPPFHLSRPAGGETVHACTAEACARVALQSCARCGQTFCNQHARPVERDLPTRGLKLSLPEWICYDCVRREAD